MDNEFIKRNEAGNNRSTIHVYFNEEMQVGISYGYSAYSLRLVIKSMNVDSVRGFSTALELPYVFVSENVLKYIIGIHAVEKSVNKEHYIVSVDLEFDINDYTRWVNKLKEELDATNGFDTQTHISYLVPKDKFIEDGMSVFARNTKRLFDMISSFIVMIIFSPIFLICAILVRKEDGGPALYKQERIGRFGRPFYIYKFRTMRLDAEAMGPQLSHGGGVNDPRLTKIGKILRAHHLDELPQLWNVFIGDMAFVGHRPERKFYIDQILEYDKRYEYLYQIRPGVTSYATFYNGYTDTMEKMLRRLEYDLYYLGHRSWIFDIKILLKTFFSIILGRKF
ncbi:MAG: sugar transferase [Bacteroidales bacterium]|nr:sugar transferase [Bacteroidales bacterium]